MRIRKKKNAAARIAACAHYLIERPKAENAAPLTVENAASPAKEPILAINPQSYFPRPQPLHLEIGCGKGAFAVGMAKANPEVNFLALERVSDCVCLALEKAKADDEARTAAGERLADNLRFLIGDAKELPALLPAHSVSCLYLNFSDPWPKKGYAKRRLTHRAFLELYRNLLIPGGLLRFKTDNEALFDFSCDEFAACGLRVVWQTRNLHASEKSHDNVMTEYEKNFSDLGQPIYSAWVKYEHECR